MQTPRLYIGISVFWLALSLVFDGLNTLVLPDYLLNFTAESRQATVFGLMTFGGLLFGMIIQPIAGVWSDRLYQRWGRRGTLGMGVLLLLIALTLFGLTNTVANRNPLLASSMYGGGWWGLMSLIFISYLLIQGAASVAQAAQQGFIPDLVPAQRRGMAAGLKGFMDVGGALLGFMLLGALLGSGQISSALAVMGIAVVICYGLTLILVRESVSLGGVNFQRSRLFACTQGKEFKVGAQSFRDAFKIDTRAHSVFMRLVLARFLFLLATYAVGRFLLYFIADRLGLDRAAAAEQAAGLLAGLTLVTVIAAPAMGWLADRKGRVPTMIGGALLSAVGVLFLMIAHSSGTILLAGSLMALGSASFSSANWAMTADVIPSYEAARFMALANIGTAGAAATAGLFGLLIDSLGYTLLFISAAAIFVGSAAVLQPMMKAIPPPVVPRQPYIKQEEVRLNNELFGDWDF